MLSQSLVRWYGGGIANCSGIGYGGGFTVADSKLHMMDAAIAGCNASFSGAGLVASHMFGDTTAASIGNLTNVSVSDW